MPTAPSTIVFARRDDRAGLLPLQHGGGDFCAYARWLKRASSTSTPAFSSRCCTSCLQMVGDRGRRSSQGDDVILVMRIVGIARCSVAKRSLALHLDVVLVVVDLEHGFRRLHHAPDHDRGDLDGIAVGSFTLSCELSKLRTRSEILVFVDRTGSPSAIPLPLRCRRSLPKSCSTFASLGATMKKPLEQQQPQNREYRERRGRKRGSVPIVRRLQRR